MKDEPLLREIYKDGRDIVFVTADDDLPAETSGRPEGGRRDHRTIAPFERGKWLAHPEALSDEEAWKREIVSRWAHAMQEQEARTFRRYYLNGGRLWVPRKRSVV